MHKYLKDLIVCPICKKELIWNVISEDDVHVINAKVDCPSCHKEYFIKDKIACFLADYKADDDNWQRGDDYLTNYFKDNPQIKDELLQAPVETLNAADLYTRASLEKIQGNEEEALRLSALGYEKAYTPESQNATRSQLAFVVKQFVNKSGFILDIASGAERLVSQLRLHTKMDIISTDISFSILKKCQADLMELEINRMSYIAFDANYIPFKDGSIKNITTNAGLQNIEKPTEIINELRRVCKGKFFAICGFCPEADFENKKVLEQWGIDKLWIKDRLVFEFVKAGWKVNCHNSIITEVKPTPMGEIVKGVGIDGFPVTDSHFESCTMEFS